MLARELVWQQAYIALGGNIGDVLVTFAQVLRRLSVMDDVRAVRCSSAFKSLALTQKGYDAELPAYWNAVCAVETTLAPLDLLRVMQGYEDEAGRLRHGVWESRTLDLDLLSFAEQVQDEGDLQLPHPRLAQRGFVLQPFMELAADYRVPGFDRSVRELVAEHRDIDEGIVEKRENWLTL